ncbi:hypothetical protein [Bacillus ndiopicus]|uniref:hypothetical protein n=1 Tax=Bacillus ndiopicus TaxID=1347368 RepID=UPI00069481AB|nr:hypothetical protein [Bacillus ndiopicus]
MKKLIYLIGFTTIFLFSCSPPVFSPEQYIEVDKYTGNGDEYEDFYTVTSNKEVQTVREILNTIVWEQKKIDMERPPDYRFIFQFKDPKIEAKAVPYAFWINQNIVELAVLASSDQYVQLDENQSAEFFEILTRDKLK